jgi:hypothetical protein
MDIETKTLKNAAAVIDYLYGEGWQISRVSFYRHKSEGKIKPERAAVHILERDRPYALAAVKRYAKHFLKRRDPVDLLIELAPEIINQVAGDPSKLEEFIKYLKEHREWLTR